MNLKNKSRKNKFAICSILVLALFANICNIYAARYDKENFPVSYESDTFPDTYKPYIDELKAAHPNWKFKAVYTGLDWNEALLHETYAVNEGVSLIPDSYGAAWKKDGLNYYKDGNFVIASRDAVAFMLDPRSHLNEQEIFQFETLKYSSVANTKEIIEKILYGTSMYQRSEYKNNGKMINMGKQYSDIILQVAKETNVSATFIASRIKQETGGDIINNGSINGSFSGYEGYYNFFNIGATPPNPISNGLAHAKSKGWTTPEISIREGVKNIKKQWIDWGQDTTYFQKWDVNNEGNAIVLYGSQYMTNIMAPSKESEMTYIAYEKAGRLNDTFEFHIPVFEGMTPYPIYYPGSNFEADNTRIQVKNVNPDKLKIRNGSSTNSPIIAQLSENTQLTRVAKSKDSQWDYVRLDNGLAGYAFRDYTVEVSNLKPDSVSLNTNKLNLLEGQNADLIATVSPNNAVNKAVKWSSSNESIATVDQTGQVTAKTSGDAVITVTTVDGNKTATCNVTVDYIKVESIVLNQKNVLLQPGKTTNLTAIIAPDNAKIKGINWKSSDEAIATIDENGLLTAVKEGNVTITATTKDQAKIDTCNVVVENYVEVTNITLNHTEKSIRVNENFDLIATVQPDNAKIKEVEWKSSNEAIATVDQTGKVTAKASGNVIITAKAKNQDITANCNVTVMVDVVEIKLDKTTYNLKLGDKTEVIPVIKPDNATNREYKVEILDDTIASYENNCIVAKKSGETTIKFISNDNASKYIEIKVKVFDINSGDIFIDESLRVDSEDKYISKIEPGSKVMDIKDKILTSHTVKYINAAGQVLNDDSLIGTGTRVVITDPDGNIVKEYNICIYGDITGEGVINSADLLVIRKYLLGVGSLENVFFNSADISKDKTINSLDLLMLRKHLLETELIIQ